MTQVVLTAEKRNHQLEWFNVYNEVDIALATRDAGGLSTNDFELARQIDQAGTMFVRNPPC